MEPRGDEPALRPAAGPGGHQLVRPELAVSAAPAAPLLFSPLKLPGLEQLHPLPPPQLHPLQLQQQLYSLALQQLQQAQQLQLQHQHYPHPQHDPVCRPSLVIVVVKLTELNRRTTALSPQAPNLGTPTLPP